jgi:peroxiredoxin
MLDAGAQAPSFSLPALDGGSRSLEEILARGPAVLAFFKVSCPVCQMTWPYLEKLHRGGLQIVGISQDKEAATRSYIQEFGATFPHLLDDPKQYAASNAYRLTSVPSLFLVEPDGRISTAVSGFSKQELTALGARAGVQPFAPGERVPEFRPG